MDPGCSIKMASTLGLKKPRNTKDLDDYESYRILRLKASKPWSAFKKQQGLEVTQRDAQGNPLKGTIRVLSDNPANDIRIVGDHNNWKPSEPLKPIPNSPYFEGEITVLSQGMEYNLQLNGQTILDPAAAAFTTPGFLRKTKNKDGVALHSVFWDSQGPLSYKMRHPSVDLRGKPVVIAESEVRELVRHWKGGPRRLEDTYKFVTESGVISELKEMGYNAVEFLPFNASLDGDSWHLRYQVFGNFAPDTRYGTPDEFARMIDTFNENGIGVIMDSVVGHYPFQGNQGDRSIAELGLHRWLKADGRPLFGNEMSPWNTYRYDYSNPHVRRFLKDGILDMIRNFRISGVRFDNLDGIRFANGGAPFLEELVREVRAYQPETYLFGEMFFGDNRVLRRIDQNGIGMSTRTDSDFFDFIKDNAQKNSEDIDMERLKNVLRKPWEWKEAARTKYVTNHDEAANRRDGATGEYFASLVQGGGDYYAQGKTKAFASLSMLSGSEYLDMPQLRLMQRGNFYANPGVEWNAPPGAESVRKYMGALTRYVTARQAFAFENLHPHIENHVDNENKVISLLRIDQATGKKFYAVVNLSHKELKDYSFGVDAAPVYRVGFDGDASVLGGEGRLKKALPGGNCVVSPEGMHGKEARVTIPVIAPYTTLILESP